MARTEQLFCALKQTQAKDIAEPSAVLDMVREWKGMGENLLNSLVDCISDVESREKNLSLVRESVEKRLKDLERRERNFDLLGEVKSGELKLREEKLDEQLKLVHEHIEKLEVSQREVEGLRLRECEKLKEMEKREMEVDFAGGLLEKRLREVEKKEKECGALEKRLREVEKRKNKCDALGKRLSEVEKREKECDALETRLREVEKREKEFDALRNSKLREMAMKEELLSRKKKEFVEEVELANEKLREKQKLGCGLIESLESALGMLEGMKGKVDERFKEIESWEAAAHESLTAKLNEADLVRELLEKRFEEFAKIEKEFNLLQEGRIKLEKDAVISKENEVEKKKELELKKGSLGILKNEHDSNGRRGKSPSSVIEFPRTCIKENHTFHQPQENLVGNHAGSIADKDHQQTECRSKEVELEGNPNDVHIKEQELKKSELTDALEKDWKILEMFINGTEKDLELMDDEIFKFLLLSSDPAKVVLDALARFYTPHLGEGSMEFKVRRLGILLLDQLTKMSPKIQPYVTEAAIKLALEWKAKMSTTAENPLEVLGFLHLLAAYNLSSYFDKDELFSLLKSVAQHKQTPELCRILGLTEKIPGFIQNLISEKQYLLASTYIYECELENTFTQASVLSYYVKHSTLSPKAKYRREHDSSEALDKAVATEIADLRVAIEHIVKYGLESDYSPDVLTTRIKQLEMGRASLRFQIPSSSADIRKQEKAKRSWDASKRKERQKQNDDAKEAATAPKAQMPYWGSESRSSPAWKAQNWQSRTEKHSSTSPVGFHKPRNFVNEVPMTHHSRAQKRRRTYL